LCVVAGSPGTGDSAGLARFCNVVAVFVLCHAKSVVINDKRWYKSKLIYIPSFIMSGLIILIFVQLWELIRRQVAPKLLKKGHSKN